MARPAHGSSPCYAPRCQPRRRVPRPRPARRRPRRHRGRARPNSRARLAPGPRPRVRARLDGARAEAARARGPRRLARVRHCVVALEARGLARTRRKGDCISEAPGTGHLPKAHLLVFAKARRCALCTLGSNVIFQTVFGTACSGAVPAINLDAPLDNEVAGLRKEMCTLELRLLI